MADFLALRGLAAFSASRLSRVQDAVRELAPGIVLNAEHWYFLELESALSEQETQRLKDLLDIPASLPPAPAGNLLLVTPRVGTISPWSSKATDIGQNCGFSSVKRIERGIAYYAGGGSFDRSGVASRLHDRMTESVLASMDDAGALFQHVAPQPLTSVDVLSGGREALIKANSALGLALSDDEAGFIGSG